MRNRHAIWLRLRALAIALRAAPTPDDAPIDIDDIHRQREIREADYQRAIDAQAKVLRVKGKGQRAARPIAAVVERRR
jgi:hypothetical protein